MSANIDFINEITFKSRTGISDAIDGKQLKPQIKIAQDMYLQPALGSTLYLRLQTGVGADNLTVSETTLLDTYITDCLVWYTMSLLPFALGYQFFSKGVLQKTSEESQAPSRADLELISNQYKQTAEFYKQRLVNYLQQNYTLFPEYYTYGAGYDVIFPQTKVYTCPIYLGGNYLDTERRVFGNNSASGTPSTVYVTPGGGLTTFQVPQLSGNITVILATRAGLAKGITSIATVSTYYLQINGTTITLPTGDITIDDEVYSFTYR